MSRGNGLYPPQAQGPMRREMSAQCDATPVICSQLYLFTLPNKAGVADLAAILVFFFLSDSFSPFALCPWLDRCLFFPKGRQPLANRIMEIKAYLIIKKDKKMPPPISTFIQLTLQIKNAQWLVNVEFLPRLPAIWPLPPPSAAVF